MKVYMGQGSKGYCLCRWTKVYGFTGSYEGMSLEELKAIRYEPLTPEEEDMVMEEWQKWYENPSELVMELIDDMLQGELERDDLWDNLMYRMGMCYENGNYDDFIIYMAHKLGADWLTRAEKLIPKEGIEPEELNIYKRQIKNIEQKQKFFKDKMKEIKH